MALAKYDLFAAVESCDLVRLEKLLDKGVKVNRKNRAGQTPLSLAAEAGHLDVAALLLQRGADANLSYPRANNETPLYLAAINGHSDVVRVLLQHGANVDPQEEEDKWTPLLAASEKGHANVVSALLEYGADTNAKTKGNGDTPLHLASHYGHVRVVSLLLEHGADINAVTEADENTPLHLASFGGHVRVVSALLDHGATTNASEGQNGNAALPLHAACQEGHVPVVAVLLEHGADVNARAGSDGAMPLHLASFKGCIDVVSLLLKYGADVNGKRKAEGATPLLSAACQGHVPVVDILLSYGANVNAKSETDGSTSLLLACNYGHVGVVRLLLEKQVDINSVGNFNDNPRATPLYIATHEQYWDIVTLLLKKQANIHAAFPLLQLDDSESVVKWMNQDQTRTILSLRELDPQGEGPEVQTSRKLLQNWDMVVAFLWYAFYAADQKGEPPLISNTRSLNNEDFKKAHKWMIHAVASLLYVNGMVDLLLHLWPVLSPNDGAALTASEYTGMTPLMAALDTYGGPDRDEPDEESHLDGLVFLIEKQTPNALQVRHPRTKRIPLACAIDKGVPFLVLRRMAQGWASSRIQLDAVTGLPIYLLVAAKYDVFHIYEFTRDFVPDLVSKMTSARDEPVVEELPMRKKRRIDMS